MKEFHTEILKVKLQSFLQLCVLLLEGVESSSTFVQCYQLHLYTSRSSETGVIEKSDWLERDFDEYNIPKYIKQFHVRLFDDGSSENFHF